MEGQLDTPERAPSEQIPAEHLRGWHSRSIDSVLAALRSNPDGLTADEAAQRLSEHGPNRLPAAPRPHSVLRFLRQFHNTLIYFLLSASVAAWVLTGAPLSASPNCRFSMPLRSPLSPFWWPT